MELEPAADRQADGEDGERLGISMGLTRLPPGPCAGRATRLGPTMPTDHGSAGPGPAADSTAYETRTEPGRRAKSLGGQRHGTVRLRCLSRAAARFRCRDWRGRASNPGAQPRDSTRSSCGSGAGSGPLRGRSGMPQVPQPARPGIDPGSPARRRVPPRRDEPRRWRRPCDAGWRTATLVKRRPFDPWSNGDRGVPGTRCQAAPPGGTRIRVAGRDRRQRARHPRTRFRRARPAPRPRPITAARPGPVLPGPRQLPLRRTQPAAATTTTTAIAAAAAAAAAAVAVRKSRAAATAAVAAATAEGRRGRVRGGARMPTPPHDPAPMPAR